MGNNNFVIIAGSIAIILIIVFYFFRKIIFASSFFTGLKKFALGIWEGIVSVKKMERKWAFIFHTLIIWVCYYLMTYLIFFSLPATANLGPMAGLVILIVGGLGMSAPTQGGIGAFHYLVAGALQLFYGLTEDDGVAYALLIHTSQLVTVLIVGLFSLIICFFIARKFKLEEIVPQPAK
jgi:glycosyltransferase 2 family protein